VKRLTSVIMVLGLADYVFGQTPCNTAAIEKQQRQLSRQVGILHLNFLTFWNQAYPKGAPFSTRNGASARDAAWTPKYKIEKDVISVNDGLGCIVFMKPNSPSIPSLCAPVDVQAQLAMEVLREDFDNGRNVPAGNSPFNTEETHLLSAARNAIPVLWAEEKTLYCVLRPDAQYINLDDALEGCTPNDKK
jgi:hypothetical protein